MARSFTSGSKKAGPTQPGFTCWHEGQRTLGEMGALIEDMMFSFLEDNPDWRSKSLDSGIGGRLFPLVPDHVFSGLPSSCSESWLTCVCMSLNSYYGVEILPTEVRFPRSRVAKQALAQAQECIETVMGWSEESELFSWEELWRAKTVDYSGEEVHTAQSFGWANIEPTIPQEVGLIPLEKVCTQGTLAYVQDFESFLVPEDEMVLKKAPRVQVNPEDWREVCEGLLSRGLCSVMPVDELFHVNGQPVLSGLFGVTKNEFTSSGVEHLRLIMNLTPVNDLCRPLESDVGTLPSWACMSPLLLGDNEQLVVSSEDIRCFFYIFQVPLPWRRYLGFNREVPVDLLPEEWRGRRCVLVGNVLPMGFINSVGIAQHVHRNVIKSAWGRSVDLPLGEGEVRKDRPLSLSPHLWRVYLDNFDELQKVDRKTAELISNTPSLGTLLVREEYERLGMPRHPKKSVAQAQVAEVQGAIVDGGKGIIYPKPSKMLKYMQVVIRLVQDGWANQRQLQVAAGGLVYVSMFRRPMLGLLNGIWGWIESFKNEPPIIRKRIPREVQWELLRFLGLLPLARLDLRLELSPTVTASDASLSGGGFCSSTRLTPYGCAASNLLVRGEVPDWESFSQVLSVGLFDGVGALRVSLDALGAPMCGHISVECNKNAQRVLEANFADSLLISSVEEVDDEMVLRWSLKFSSASLVILGAGPPCQGVSGLNSERKGALRDCRSSLFKHVERIYKLLKRRFYWCQVQKLMESVLSMDPEDRQVMSEAVNLVPWAICASGVSLARRPRLYWLGWELIPSPGFEIEEATEESFAGIRKVRLHAKVDPADYLEPGWGRADTAPLPTFTTSRPRTAPGPRPAGLATLSSEERRDWQNDLHRFPPYQYKMQHRMVHPSLPSRLPSVSERECILGFPLGYTKPCVKKNLQGSVEQKDIQLTLLGNTWSVFVISLLLQQLLETLGLVPRREVQEVVALVSPGGGQKLQSYLFRPPIRQFRKAPQGDGSKDLIRKLSSLVSQRGEDLLLQPSSESTLRYQRIRWSIPSRLWKWKVIGSWPWKSTQDHINLLELRAIWTSIRWRVERQRVSKSRFLHLTDSAVCLNALVRGRSSSRKLRPLMSRINSVLLACRVHPLWGYVSSSTNPADKPSRRVRKQCLKRR